MQNCTKNEHNLLCEGFCQAYPEHSFLCEGFSPCSLIACSYVLSRFSALAAAEKRPSASARTAFFIPDLIRLAPVNEVLGFLPAADAAAARRKRLAEGDAARTDAGLFLDFVLAGLVAAPRRADEAVAPGFER